MAFTYDTALTAQKDQVRLIVGDTDSADALLADEEIVWLIAQEGGVAQAAIAACNAIAAKLARETDLKVSDGGGSIAVSGQRTAQQYLDLAKTLQARLGSKGLTVFAGGLTDSDGNEKQPAFTRDLHGNPGGSGITSI